MSTHRHHTQRLTWLITAMVIASPMLLASEREQPSRVCELCGDPSGWELDISAGPGYVSGDNFKFGDYSGLNDDGLHLFGDVFARYWGESAEFMRIEGYRLGLDSRALLVEGGKQGVYKLRASYQGIPRKLYDSTVTPYNGSGTDTLSLPTGWVRAPTTQGMTQLNGSSQRVKIDRDWDIYSVGADYTPSSHWAFDINYRRQERDGNTITSGSFFFDAAQFGGPVDDATDEVQVSAAFNADTWQIDLSYQGSYYDNNNNSLTWANAYTAQAPGADSGRLALSPDNEAHQISLTGSWRLPRRTTLTGQISLGRMEQDESFLPYTSNALVVTSALPRSSVDAQVDTTHINLRAVSSPLQKLTLQAEFRYDERDNDTQENTYNYVVTDLSNAADAATNIAYDYQRYDYKIRGEYRLPARARLSAGYDHERDERTRQERDETKTDRLWAQVRKQEADIADIDIKAYTEDRDGSNYTPIVNIADPQNPLMRKYNMADRERNGFKLYVSTYAGDRLNLGAEMEYNKDNYDKSDIGLQRSTYRRYGVDASYLFHKDISAYASFYREDIWSRQANSQSFTNSDWEGRTDDLYYTTSAGIRYPDIVGRMGASLEYSYARSEGETKNDTSGLASDFPKLRSKLHQLKFGLDYPYNKSTTLSFNYLYEKFKTEDWMLENVEPATIPNLLSLGADPYDYDTHVFFVGIRYVFDSRGQAGPRLMGTADNNN